MSIASPATVAAPSVPARGAPAAAPRRFALALALLLALLAAATRPAHNGDFLEYGLMTVALASHASPDIRPADLETARLLQPGLGKLFGALEQGMRARARVPLPGFFSGNDGRYYALHFFAYPLLAAVPYRLLQALGLPPFKCFQVVNAAFVFVLGLALYRLFGSARRACAGLVAFALSGGMLYWQWSSTECMSAAALLAALLLYAGGAPLAAGVLAGLGAMQNPPLVLFCAFAPLLRLCLCWRRGAGLGANLRAAWTGRHLAGAAACAALCALPVLFNLYAFATPNLIARDATNIGLISANRLHSFFFDLSQGMLVGVPAIAPGLVALAWRARARELAVAGVALLFAVALALPSLATHNWNSAAAGMMRYALWGAMPLLFAFLWLVRARARWPGALLAAVLLAQAGAMAHARRYSALEFSPVARAVLARAPGWYNPDPEIFYERSVHAERPLPDKTYSYVLDGVPVKTLYRPRNPSAAAQLCGAGRAPAPGTRYADADLGWRYINGPVRCVDAR